MPKTKAAPTGQSGRQKRTSQEAAGAKANALDGEPTYKRYEAQCFAGHPADATYKEWYGGWGWQIGCYHDHRHDPDYLPLMAEHYGLDRGASKDEIAAAMSVAGGYIRPEGPPAPVPTLSEVQRWTRRLAKKKRAMRYLLEERGLTERVVREAGVGYTEAGEGPWPDWAAAAGFTFPVFKDGQVVTVRKRFWPEVPVIGGKPVKCVSLYRHHAQLYPELPPTSWAVLCEGELDALVARSHGLTATVTGTAGMSLSDELAAEFTGKRVAVVFDVGYESVAARNAQRLRDAGALEAWPVALGLPNEDDDLGDWFGTYGRSVGDLVELIRRARKAARA